MKQKLLNSLRLRACMLVAVLCAGVSAAWGEETVYKTLSFPDDNSSSNGLTSNQYASTWIAKSGSDQWSISNFNNNNWSGNWTFIKCGRKNNASVATITTSAVIDKAISKVVVTIDAITASKVNSIKLYTSSDNSKWTEAGTFEKSTGKIEVSLATPTANLYYKIEFDCASGSSNGLVTVSKVEYYYEETTSGNTTLELSEPKDAQGNVVTTFYVNSPFYIYPTTNSTGAVSCTSSDDNVLKVMNPDYYLNPEYNNPIKAYIIAKGEGTATLTFKVAAHGDFEEVSKSVTITVVKIPTECQIIEPEGFNTDIANDETAGRLKGQLKNIYNVYNSQSENEAISSLFTWSSSDATVATIAEDGTVTLVGAGTTIITCNFAGDNQYEASSANKELTVTNSDAPAPITLWSEDFGSYSADDVPSGGTYGYVCGDGNGGSTTKVYEQNTAGGTSPELLVAKKNGTFTAVVPLNRASGQLTLKYKTNAKALYVSTTTEGVEGGGSFDTSGEHTVTFTGVTPDKTSITIVFTATTSDNVRLDDIELVGSAEVNAVEAPTFSINGGTYYTPQTVELSCDTEGAAIKYSFDGTSWNDYTEALTINEINETKTIYAKAVKDGKESTVSSITVTIAEKNAVVFNVGEKELNYEEVYTVTRGSGKDVESDGYVTVSSSNTNVATVEGLKITAVGVGTATITLSVREGDTYKEGSTTFTVTVKAPEGQTTAPTSANTIFEEHFNAANGTGGNENPEATVENLWSGTIAQATFASDNVGWENTKGNSGYKCAKIGTGSAKGSATTPVIAFDASKTYTLTFKAGAWSGDKTEGALVLFCSDNNATLSQTTFDLNNAAWGEYSVTISGANNEATITFSAAQASKNRFFLDEVVITDPNAAAPTFSVELNASGYATYCNQYPLDFTNNEDVTAWALTGIENNDDGTYKMNYTQITGAVKGGVGMLLKGEATDKVEIKSKNCEDTDTPDTNLFVGTLAPTFVEKGAVYGLSGSTFKKSASNGNVKANKAYIPADAMPKDAKSFIFVFEDEATGVRTIETHSAEDAKAIFNIAGQRLQNMQKGINIVGGKKILVK